MTTCARAGATGPLDGLMVPDLCLALTTLTARCGGAINVLPVQGRPFGRQRVTVVAVWAKDLLPSVSMTVSHTVYSPSGAI